LHAANYELPYLNYSRICPHIIADISFTF
jgi:hypothetical protein